MKSYITFFAALFISAMAVSQPAKHVILVTIDGFRPDFYLDSSWPTPHIRQLVRQGTHALGENSVFPSMTYPSHTTIVTGVQPAEHGVFYNNLYEPEGSTGKIYWNDSSIKVPTLWKAVRDNGMRASALFWPVSAGAPVDYNIPDIGSMGEDLRRRYSRPAGFLDTMRNLLFDQVPRIDYGRDVNVAKIAAWIIKQDKPNLLAVHFFSVDHAEHMQGREGEMVRQAIAGADSGIAIIMAAIKTAGIPDSTVLIVTGDHGFVNVEKTLSPNVWLARAGLQNDIRKGDWKAQFFTVGGSAWLYLKDVNDRNTLSQVRELLTRLPDNVKLLFRVVSRQQLDNVGANPGPVLVLSGENNTAFTNVNQGEALTAGHGGTHGYYPDFEKIQTGFVAAGPGITRGGELPVMDERDVAPIIARLLGIPFPSAKGQVPPGLLVP